MRYYILIIFLFSLVSSASCQNYDSSKVYFGDEVLIKEHLDLLYDKKVGVVINQSSVLSNGTHFIDSLISLGIEIITLFSPEHGIRGNYAAGVIYESTIDKITGLPVYSLYGKNKKPSNEMLKGIDILLFDIQDIGVRFYTYISTLYYSVKAAIENKIPLFILDRPNPLGGELVAGPVLEKEFKSFIGIEELPVLHGMTIGELALYFQQKINKDKNESEINVIKMKGWNRSMIWTDLNREWIPTSPNIPTFETAVVYPGICFLEGTNISEGRGTDKPFLIFGAPFINSLDLTNSLQNLGERGISFDTVEFVPINMNGKTLNPKHEGVHCNGIQITINNIKKFNPVNFGVKIIYLLGSIFPDQFIFLDKHFDKLAGTDRLRKDLISGKSPNEIISGWEEKITIFKSKRRKYLLY